VRRERISLASVVAGALSLTLLGGVLAAVLLPPPQAPAAAAGPAPAAEPLPEPGLDAVPVPAAQAAPVPVAIAPLERLRAPDLVVTLPGPMAPEQVAALSSLPGLEALAVVDAGSIGVAGAPVRVLGVDPSTFRAFTPQDTAASDELWRAVARGEVIASFGLARDRSLGLGTQVPLSDPGGSAAPAGTGRIGAHAAFGLPGVDLLTDTATTRRLGVAADSGALVSAPTTAVTALRAAVEGAVGPGATVEVLRPEVARAPAGRPASYRELYVDAARYCPGLSWTVLAAIGQVESGHGKHLGPSSAGALGPMQFLPSTWAAYGVDGDGDGSADIMNPFDAVPSAASYLCRSGASRGEDGLYDAIFAYNHADWYVQKVLGLAAQYQ
jgi:hypothetical protein